MHNPMSHRVHVFCGVLPLQPIEKRLKCRGVVRQILLLFDECGPIGSLGLENAAAQTDPFHPARQNETLSRTDLKQGELHTGRAAVDRQNASHAGFAEEFRMSFVIGLAGLALIAVMLIDAFETVLLPRRVTHGYRLIRLFYQGSWRIWRSSRDSLPRRGSASPFSVFSGPCPCSWCSGPGPSGWSSALPCCIGRCTHLSPPRSPGNQRFPTDTSAATPFLRSVMEI